MITFAPSYQGTHIIICLYFSSMRGVVGHVLAVVQESLLHLDHD